MQLSLAEGEEGLLAVSAGERPLPCMDQVVSGQCVRFGEALAAVGARVRSGAAVRHDVLLPSLFALESFVALRARVGPVIHVGSVVFGQFSLR